MKPPVQVAAELRAALSDLPNDARPASQVSVLKLAAEAAIQTIAAMVRDFQAEVAKELATGGYWPMATAPTNDGARILGLVQRGHAGGRAVVEPRVLVHRHGRWRSVPGGWTAPVLGWRPVPAEDIVHERGGPAW